jgi:hypothetical protein
MPNGALQPRASDEPGSQTLSAIEIAAERDGVCIATLRRAKFDIGIRNSKDGKSAARWWTLPRRMSTLGQRGKMLKYYLSTLSILSTLNETNDLFDNLAKSRAVDRGWGTHHRP